MRTSVSATALLAVAVVVFFACSATRAAVIYVSTEGDNSSDGLSWATAKRTVQAALNAASSGDEIWVASGIYRERITLKPDVALYGGFAGKETRRDERNWITNTTILDGEYAGTVVTIPTETTKTTRIDGFIIRNGRARYGGGIFCWDHSSPTITNNVITGNTATYDGGSIYCYFASPTISNNIIVANSAQWCGGGIFCYNSSPTISNNTIASNVSSTYGGGIYCYFFSSPTICNNIVAFNSSGIFRHLGSPVLRNNCVYNPGGYDYLGVSPGNNDIRADPLFVNRLTGNYHLRATSPCVDAGCNQAQGLLVSDADMNRRIINGVVDIGADEFTPCIADAKNAPDGSVVDLLDVVVTAVFEDSFYVESEDRSQGIRVEKADCGLKVGSRVSITGTIKTNTNGERYVEVSSLTLTG